MVSTVVVIGVHEVRIANFGRFCAPPMAEQWLPGDNGLEKLVFCFRHFYCSEGVFRF